MKIDKKDDLPLDTFKEVILKAGYIEMEENEIEELFEKFTDANEFFSLLRVSVLVVFFLSCFQIQAISSQPRMSATRLNAVNKAFSKLDPDKKGSTDFTTFKKIYIVDKHPKYQNGDYTKASIFQKILTNFKNNIITRDDFINYYAAISAQIERDIYFDLLMRECYNL